MTGKLEKFSSDNTVEDIWILFASVQTFKQNQ